MKIKIAIGGVCAIIVLGGIYSMSQPKEVIAPITIEEEITQASDTDTMGTTVSQPGASTTTQTRLEQGAPTQVKPVSTKSPTTGSTPVTPSPAPFIGTVYYDEGTFIPETITIVQGGTVQFVNLSDRKMWIASNKHPDHSRYPVKSPTDCLGSSFDECTAIGKGSSWSFTFSELGEWRYHNHIRSTDEGNVIVLTKEQYLKLQEAQQ